MNSSYTIAESYVLPSKGLIYDTPINPNVKIRSMTTQEEMRRLAPSDTPYKTMSDIIDTCLVEKPKLSAYNMCLGDYQFLLHKLRVVTYGAEYKMGIKCPFCGGFSQKTLNLDDIAVNDFNEEEIKKLMTVKLPQCDKTIELQIQTPKSLDDIALRKKEMIKKGADKNIDHSYILTLASLIKTVDGKYLNPAELETFVKKLPMRDANILLQTAEKLNRKVGLETILEVECDQCGSPVLTNFRITSEFFGPTID